MVQRLRLRWLSQVPMRLHRHPEWFLPWNGRPIAGNTEPSQNPSHRRLYRTSTSQPHPAKYLRPPFPGRVPVHSAGDRRPAKFPPGNGRHSSLHRAIPAHRRRYLRLPDHPAADFRGASNNQRPSLFLHPLGGPQALFRPCRHHPSGHRRPSSHPKPSHRQPSKPRSTPRSFERCYAKSYPRLFEMLSASFSETGSS